MCIPFQGMSTSTGQLFLQAAEKKFLPSLNYASSSCSFSVMDAEAHLLLTSCQKTVICRTGSMHTQRLK